MSLLDVILILVVFAFVLAGFWFGFVHALGAVVGTVLSVAVAARYYDVWGKAVAALFFGNVNLARTIMFLVIMIAVNRLVGLVFWLIKKAFKIASFIPFMKTFNALLGGTLGFIEGILVVGGVLFIAARYPFSPRFASALAASKIALWLLHAFAIFMPLVPQAVRRLKAVIQ